MRQKYLTLAFTAIVLSMSSCSKSIDENIEPTEKKVVEVLTRSSSAASIEYPLTLYAFSSDGTLAESTTANDADDPLQMQLPVGDSYRLVALAGAAGLTPVTTPTASTGIGIPTNGLITSPVQMGQADISTVTTDVEANLTLSYQVAQLTVQLHNIPVNATAVNVTLSSLYTNETFEGTLSGKGTITIPLAKTENATTWAASTVYTLPGVDNTALVIGINIASDNRTQNYSYSHTSTLQSGTPYSLIGTYDGEFNLTSTLTPEGWNPPEEISFTFGAENLNNGGDTPGNNGSNNGDAVYNVETLPTVRTIWNGHFVAEVSELDNNTAELLLLSLEEWETAGANVSQCISSNEVFNYSENGITGWRIPDYTELSRISPGLSSSTNIDKTNSTLQQAGGTKLTTSYLYLCKDSENIKSVQLNSNPQTKNLVNDNIYHFRLVRTVTVCIQ